MRAEDPRDLPGNLRHPGHPALLVGEAEVADDAIDGVVVAFEADAFDAAARSGWSVVVTGRATVVADPDEHERLSQAGPTSWMPLRDAVFARIESETTTGRELRGRAARGEAARRRVHPLGRVAKVPPAARRLARSPTLGFARAGGPS
ncbi:hypothetical protein GCM10017771_83540 [Streptomyces capitiformicae]|uniref:Pyridoxamine 5'-phosphate oxidase n=1 Tax=Streptomyces capitiformicae TaxID=2014920 RepID=A0A919DNL9_9ACTN|nr:hypothetical protein GCM10017771_83540 [Streptomyces capitiformicae]